MGRSLDLVKERCFRGRHQPLLVFYANQDGEPIASTKAPQGTKVVSKEELLSARFISERTRGKDAVRVTSPKQKGAKKLADKEEREQDGPAKRKSFSKLVGSAFGRSKSLKSKSGKGRQTRYSGDHVLSVNGQDVRKDRELLNRSLDEQQVWNNCYAEEDTPEQRKKSGGEVKDWSSASGVRSKHDASAGTEASKSPGKSSNDFVKMNGKAHQTQRLQKHQQHLRSLGSKLDTTGDSSDYDNFERPKSNTKHQRTRTSPEIFGADRRRDDELSPVRSGGYSYDNRVDPGVQESHHQHRRFIDQGGIPIHKPSLCVSFFQNLQRN